jgi:hypothetical protein
MSEYLNLTKYTPEQAEAARKNLLEYCCLDTLAMVKILEELYRVSEENDGEIQNP